MTINAPVFAARFNAFSIFSVRVETVGAGGLRHPRSSGCSRKPPACRGRRAHHRAADQAETEHANGRFRHGIKGGT